MSFSCLDVAKAAGLQGETRRGKEIAYRCPRHDDTTPSLAIDEGKDVWMCGPCARKGKAWALAAFIANLDAGDKPAVTAWLKQHGVLNGHAARLEVATYPYDDEHGTVLYEKVRTEPKGFYLRRPDGSTSLDGVRRVPYRLGALAAARPAVLFVAEGERDVDRLVREGLQATTNDTGAGKWTDTYTETLVAVGVRHVVILRDHDEPGHRHGVQVARSFHARGVRVTIPFVVGLHDATLPAKHGQDISDWFAAGHTVDELRAIVDQTPDWTPEGDPAPAAPETPPRPDHWKRLDLADLATWPVEPLEPIVDGLIARGNLVYVAAASQTGKTLLWLYIAQLLVRGGSLFGRFPVYPVERLLYLVLEDPDRRIAERLRDTAHEFADQPPIAPGRCVFDVVPGFSIVGQDWPAFEAMLDAEQPDLTVVDTYQKATPGLSSFDDEKQGIVLHQLSNTTRKRRMTLVILDHVRKISNGSKRGELSIDDVKGTGGKVQNADVVILMDRTADRKQLKVQAFSKDFDAPVRILIDVSPKGSTGPKFTYAGDLEALGTRAKDQADARKQRVLQSMQPGTWYSIDDLQKPAGVAHRTLQRYLNELAQAEKLDTAGKGKKTRYCIRDTDSRHKPPRGANSDN